MRMIREFRHLKLMKRHARGNIEHGIMSTAHRDLATLCPACLIPGVNLPEKWEDVGVEWK